MLSLLDTTLEIVTNETEEGGQFVYECDGIGGSYSFLNLLTFFCVTVGIFHESIIQEKSNIEADTELIDHSMSIEDQYR